MSTTVPHIESVPHERPDEPITNALQAVGAVGAVGAIGDVSFEHEHVDALSPLAVPVIGSLFVTAGVVTGSSVLVSTGLVLLVLAGGAWLMRGH